MSARQAAVAGAIAGATGLRIASRPAAPVSGGSRDGTWRWPTRGRKAFGTLARAGRVAAAGH